MMANFSFTRKWLEDILGNEELSEKEKAKQIVDGHLTELNEIKDERDNLRTQAADLQKQLDDVTGGEDYKEKYEKEHKAFEDFKKQTASDAEMSAVKAAYRKMLIGENISEKRIEAIMKVTDFSKMKRDKDGNLENADVLKKAIADEWGEFKATVSEKGAVVANPPSVAKPTKTREEILAIKDTSERQKAIAENLQLFGKG